MIQITCLVQLIHNLKIKVAIVVVSQAPILVRVILKTSALVNLSVKPPLPNHQRTTTANKLVAARFQCAATVVVQAWEARNRNDCLIEKQ
jgi:polysaccharide pyruvyl transferase WcaK-like protein